MNRNFFTRGVIAAVLVALVAGPVRAEASALTVQSVGGQPVEGDRLRDKLSGVVDVAGTAVLGGGGGGTTPSAPLVADAGGSPRAEEGDPATLLGAGYGGRAPYTFRWTASAGTLRGADAPTAQLETSGLAPGTYEVSLEVTDAAGATATDTVLVAVVPTATVKLHDETRTDLAPGVFGVGVPGAVDVTFDVPADVSRIDVRGTWTVPANDYDLFVYDPAGAERDTSEGPPPSTVEEAAVSDPQAGTWTASMLKYSTAADTVRIEVFAEQFTGDPRPAVDTGGPYRFAVGEPQAVSGSVSGGTAPVEAGWDTDGDGVTDASGTSAVLDLAPGRHLITLRARDAAGFERQETTSVVVATPERLAEETTALTVVGIADSGINPYHLEFSAETYPDPEVLALTGNFQRHPSEYLPGYPAGAKAIPVTLGKGYYPPEDARLWASDHSYIKSDELYWIPGTKIVGAYDASDSKPINAAGDVQPILDDDGHGTGASSVSVGNRYGYCPTCLLMFVEGLDETVNATLDWVDVTSNSFGPVAGVPVDLALEAGGIDTTTPTKTAAERGQLTFFAAGNGLGNAFDVPQVAYGNVATGADWNIVVGALRRDNQRAIVGDALTVHISSWGDGNLPSACRTGTVGQCAFGGTSAASPYSAGVAAGVLNEVRRAVGDGRTGQRGGQVVAEGVPVGDGALADGKLTREELREAFLKTAFPLNQGNEPSPYPYPATAPYHENTNVMLEGYGAATPESGKRAVDVLLGRAPMPDRSFEDSFFAVDRAFRDEIWGGYDRDGDGVEDSYAPVGLGLTANDVSSAEGVVAAFDVAASKLGGADAAGAGLRQVNGSHAQTLFLHQAVAKEPDNPLSCGEDVNEKYMDAEDTAGDVEPCFGSRVTTVAAAFRPIGIWPSRTTLDAPLPAGSTVDVELYVTQENPTVLQPTGVLMATDREIGKGSGTFTPTMGSADPAACEAMGELCWTKLTWSFQTTRPAYTGEQLTFQVALLGSRAFAFGYEGAHASKITIEAAELPSTGLEFGVTVDTPAEGESVAAGSSVVAGGTATFPDLGSDPTGAGDHPTRKRVDVSVDDPTFGNPAEADYDAESGTWTAPLGSGLGEGEHTLYARAAVDRTTSEVVSRTFRVRPNAVVQWQVVEDKKHATIDPAGWQDATGLASWSYSFDTAAYGKGRFVIVTRLVEGGVETARQVVRARFG